MTAPLQWFKLGISHLVFEATLPFAAGCSFRAIFGTERQWVAFGCYDGPYAYAGDVKYRVLYALERNDGEMLAFECSNAERVKFLLPSRTCPRCRAPFFVEA